MIATALIHSKDARNKATKEGGERKVGWKVGKQEKSGGGKSRKEERKKRGGRKHGGREGTKKGS